MKKLFIVLALALLLVPGYAYASCTTEGDPSFRYGFGYLDGLPFNQPGPDYADIYAGQTLTYELGPYNAATSWLPAGCHNLDTFCFGATSALGWAVSANPALGTQTILNAGYLYYQFVSITAPCSATIGQVDHLVARFYYVNNQGVCDPSCVDCHDPNIRPADGLPYYSADTLIITVVASPPALGVFQDTLTLVDAGQTQAYIPFSVCNQDNCAPLTTYNYNVKSKGHVGAAINQSGTIGVVGGECRDVFGVLNAGSAVACAYDTLTIIVWTPTPVVYDTCVQVVHVITPVAVPLFTVPVVTILLLALILAAAVFMRRRAVSRA
jgi:hypothetical protein